MSMEFDFNFTGRSNVPRTGYAENFFRVGGDAIDYGYNCEGDGSRYPSLWLYDGATDQLYLSLSSASSCWKEYPLINITVDTIYHMHIEFNDSVLITQINEATFSWQRQPPIKTYNGRVVDVWWSSNKASGTDYNTGGGIFSNIKIISGTFTIAPTAEPTTTPTDSPSTIPTVSTLLPTATPSHNPTDSPSNTPSSLPTTTPTTSPSADPTSLPSIAPSTSPTDQPSRDPTSAPTSARDKAQLKRESFGSECNFTCWQCLRQIDIENDDEDSSAWELLFNSINETQCDCPQEKAIQRNYHIINVGSSPLTTANPNYYFEIEKSENVNADDDGDTVHELKANVIYWRSAIQNCTVSYFVNKKEFFGIRAQNVLIITFFICDLDEEQLNATKIREAEKNYVAYFATLFDLNATGVNVSIDIGSFCDNNNKRRLLANDENDEEITVVIVFIEAEDARAAEQSACDEVQQEFPSIDSCRVGRTDGTTNNDKDDETDSEEKDDLTTIQITLIIIAIVSFVIFLCILCYCGASHKKKKVKKELEMEYRRRTLSGDTMKGVVTKRKQHHERRGSNEVTHESALTVKDSHGLKGTNVSFKALPQMEKSEEISRGQIHLHVIDVNTETAASNTTASNTADTMNAITPLENGATSETNSERVKFNNTSPETVPTSCGSGSPYTLLPSYTESDTLANKEYKSEKEMIDDIVASNKAHVIEYDDVILHKQIGKGQFGAVHKATWEGNIVVVKQLKNAQIDESDSEKVRKRKEARIKEMRAEIILASSLPTHHNLVEIFGYIQSPFGVVMSYMAGDSVEKYVYRVHKKENEAIPTILELLIILRKTCAGLKFLHQNGLVHRDIACRNILLGPLNNNRIEPMTEVRLSDFGFLRQLRDKDNDDAAQKTQTTFGPLKWMAPESIKSRKYSKKSDIYMLGITMWEIFYGREPYINMTAGNVAISVVTKDKRPEIINNPQKYRHCTMPQTYRKLMQNCWAQEPQQRPSINDILRTLTLIEENPLL